MRSVPCSSVTPTTLVKGLENAQKAPEEVRGPLPFRCCAQGGRGDSAQAPGVLPTPPLPCLPIVTSQHMARGWHRAWAREFIALEGTLLGSGCGGAAGPAQHGQDILVGPGRSTGLGARKSQVNPALLLVKPG